MNIIRFAQNIKVDPYQFWVEYTNGERKESNEDQIMSLWFVWLNQTDSSKTFEGDFTVFEFGKQFLKENNLYTLIQRSEADRKKFFEQS